ncbi:CAP domain-containing protein [Streptomyces sp. NPDC051041]|uniref:CAP domain-containing protein n=1 Tax=Streptomyces sp. NPDC051041 TaxID=3365640 RepID=UPI0037928383
MGKHRKNRHYRRIVIAAVAMGAVGVPTVALACADWQGSEKGRFHDARGNAATGGWNDADRGRGRDGGEDSGPGSAASKTPSASGGARRTTAPKPGSTAPSSAPKTTPGTPEAAPSTTPGTPKAAPSTAPGTPEATPSASAGTPKAAPSTAPASPETPAGTATASGVAARIVELVNAERKKVGCSPVTLDATLTKAAQAHSEDMAAHRNMSHTGSDGSSPGDRITRAGYTWSTYGENVAYGYGTPEQVMSGWMSSPGHKANILNCAFEEIGVGLAQPGHYWTQDFGTAR